MRVIINRDDNRVDIDNVSKPIDCSQLPMDQQLVSWDDTKGVIQWRQADDVDTTTYKLNTAISDFAPYQWAVDAWNAYVPPPPPPSPPPSSSPGLALLLNHENRIRVTENLPPLTMEAFVTQFGL